MWLALAATPLILGLSAFFVAVEFALVAARGYRLREAARTSPGARAALSGARDLPLLLAGTQLGITLCTLALGSLTKPVVHRLLTPPLTAAGLPTVTADLVAFLLSLTVVTFAHLVVGEMMPKSWAIAHPERSAAMLAPAMRVFMWLTRPLLLVLNGLANWCLRRVGVRPVGSTPVGQSPAQLRHLLDHSAQVGVLDAERHAALVRALRLHTRPLGEAARPLRELAAVGPAAAPAEIARAAQHSGHLRLLVLERGRPLGVVHVRDALAGPSGALAADLMRPVLTLPEATPIQRALTMMRESRNHLALVAAGTRLVGLVTLHDLLDELLPPAAASADRS
jgi:CBS domain containing-hemolysin-like protein